MTLSPARRSRPAEDAPAGDTTPPLTRARRRRHIRAAAGPRPHRPNHTAQGRPAGDAPPAGPATPGRAAILDRPAPPRPAEPDAVPSRPPLAAPDAPPPGSAAPEPAGIPAPEPDVVASRSMVGERLPRLGVALLTKLRLRRAQHGLRRAPSARPYLVAALVRCALYLGPLGVAVAAAGPLGRVGWLVPVAVLVLGWSAAQALTCLGGSVARASGTAAAARLVAGGFTAAAGVWCAFVWVAPAGWLGPDRMLAGVVGVGGLTALATVTAALVTRAEAAVVRWSLPCCVLGLLSVAAAVGVIGDLPIGTLLPAAIVVAAVRAYRPVIGRSVPRRKPIAAADIRRAAGFLVAGAGQAVCVALLWRAGPAGVTSPAAIPLLLAVPALEMLVGWHMYQVESGMDAAGCGRDHRRHVRSVAVTTVAALLPPLAAGIALTAAAYRLPNGTAVRDGVLALAAGTLLGGLLAVTLLLAARGRTGTAATLAAVAPLAIVALPLLTPALAPLPTIVVVCAGTHLLGLLTVAHTATDRRRAS